MDRIVREILISHDSSETRVALLEDGRLAEFYVERPKRSVVGNVYLGRVRDVLPGMQAAFVDIGLEKNAFLYVDEVVAPEGVESVPKRPIAELLKPGQQLMVQVLKDPMGTKGARITTEITLPGRFLVLMPFSEFVGVSRKLESEERARLQELIAHRVPPGMGLIVRTVAQGVSERDLVSDLEFLLRLWRRVQHQAEEGLAPEVVYTEMDLSLRFVRDVFSSDYTRLVVDDRGLHEKIKSFLSRTSPELSRRVSLHRDAGPLFDAYKIPDALEQAMRRTVRLPSGGHISIDKTEALTAIDVNTGSFVGKKSLEDTVVQTNLEAADEVVRQLRLRDIGGIIVIDFIDMEQVHHRDTVMARLTAALERDRTKSRVMEFSKLGLVEMTRKNVSDGVFGTLTTTCPRCEGEGRVLSEHSVRIAVERRLRELLATGGSDAYLFGVSREAYALLTEAGVNIVAGLRAETGKQIVVVEEPGCETTEVRVLIEGRVGLLQRVFGRR